MLTEKDITGNKNILLSKIGKELMEQLSREEKFPDFLSEINTFFQDVQEKEKFIEPFRQSVQSLMSSMLNNAVEKLSLDGEEIFGNKWNEGTPDCLIWEIYDTKTSYKVIDYVINFIIEKNGVNILKYILTLKLG